MTARKGFLTPKECEECGSDPVFHTLTRWSIMIEMLLAAIAVPGVWVSRIVPPLPRRMGDIFLPPLFTMVASIKLGKITRDTDAYDFKFVTHVLWDEAKRRGIRMIQWRPFGMVKHIFLAEYGGKKIVFERMPIPHGRTRGASWIDDKSQLKKILRSHGLPTARGEARGSERGALKLFSQLHKPVIVKPHQGSGTRHTTLHIQDEEALLKAFRSAKRLSPLVMIEEELEGPVYRPTVINGSLVATIERNPPHSVGDGSHTIEELVAKENENPKRSGLVFSPIHITEAVRRELARQGYALTSTPKRGVRVELHQKVNWSVGGNTRDVTDSVHQDNRELFEEVARLVEAPIVGIDFIITDITRSWKEQSMCGVIETNSMPFFDTHHLPFEGEPRDVAGPIWDMVFPESHKKVSEN